ncbi:hypothetical protein J7J74_00855 [bacterium]|nr:hypothetical protein [bacterium]
MKKERLEQEISKEQEVSEELERLVEEYREARKTAQEAIQRAYRARQRIVSIVTNTQFNQGTDKHPLYNTKRFAIELIPYRTAKAIPSEIVAWVRATFSSRKDREEMLNAFFPNKILLEGLKIAEKRGKNFSALMKKVKIITSWRVKIREKEVK